MENRTFINTTVISTIVLTLSRCKMCNTLSDFQMFTDGAKGNQKGGFGAMAGLMGAGAAAAAAAAGSTPAGSSSAASFKDPSKPASYYNDPPDSAQLGRSTWTFLHSVAATYPEQPTSGEKSQMHTFLQIFGNIYPCWYCAEDFRDWMKRPENDPTPQLDSQDKFGRWLCAAHNAVNKKLDKKEFDCNLWKARWVDGWDELKAQSSKK